MKLLLILLILTVSVLCQGNSTILNQWTALKFNFTSTISGSDLILNIVGVQKGWIGIGYGSGMKSVDMTMITYNNSKIIIDDYWSVSDGKVFTDTQYGGASNVQLEGNNNTYNPTTGQWSITIRRPLNKVDAQYDTAINTTPGSSSLFTFATAATFDIQSSISNSHDWSTVSIMYNPTTQQNYTKTQLSTSTQKHSSQQILEKNLILMMVLFFSILLN